jgi:DNA (cytosine-5)-methyltransferase 1
MTPLVLSCFPGIGLLDMAFELEGFCVVRGPDLLWGGDVRVFHPPAGRFDGVIGGPPCQRFSSLSNINRARYGEDSLAPDLIPEFCRVVSEAQPLWFLMENVPRAPLPNVQGYGIADRIWKNQWSGGEQERTRRFSFGVRGMSNLSALIWFKPVGEVFLPTKTEPAVTATSGGRRRTPRRDRRDRLQSSPLLNRTLADMLRLQGLPPDFLADAPFTVRERMRVVGNGVPLPMGLTIARAVKKALQEQAA